MNCPSVAELGSFALGDLADERIDEISRHLESCAACEVRMAVLEKESDSFVSVVRNARGIGTSTGESAYERFYRAIANPFERLSEASDDLPWLSLPSGSSGSIPAAFGPYRLSWPLGRGGMGVVYRAWHAHLKRPVAIKLLPKSRSDDSEHIRRFSWEMEAVAKIDDPESQVTSTTSSWSTSTA